MKIRHGGNREEVAYKTGVDINKLVDFSANINPLGISFKMKKVLQEALSDIVYYPNPKYPKLKQSIASHFNIRDKEVFVGNGAMQIIFNTVLALNVKQALVLAPTFGEYERSFKENNIFVNHLALSKTNNFQVNIEVLITFLKKHPGIDLICLCNPNNPTGQLIEPKKIKELEQFCRTYHKWLILDEAFMDFACHDKFSYIPNLIDGSPVIIIRSATKFFAIPGLRLGFAVVKNPPLQEKLSSQIETWSVNTLAQKFGENMYKDQNYIKKTYLWLKKEKAYLYRQLKNIPYLKVYPSETNFYFFKSQLDHLREKLWKFGIMIRDCSDYYSLGKSYYRVAVRSHLENQKLVNSLKKLS